MQIKENYSLRHLNTFGIDVNCKYFAEFSSINELKELLQSDYAKTGLLVLGGGSNVLFTKDFDGLVLKNKLLGKEKLDEDANNYYIKVGAGENWHQFVMYCIDNDYAGIENLSLIPGCVGASPMQNIGAYGVELKDVFHELEALNIESGELEKFSKEDCAFAYRESIFKKAAKGKYIICSVTFCLHVIPQFKLGYGAILDELLRMKVRNATLKDVSNAVCNIRNSKLPKPEELGNAGSFFKNPVVLREKYESLKKEYPAIVGYEQEDGSTKLAAGWLIEQCEWKGKRIGDAGVHEKQALVLVNYKNAKGKDIYALSEKVQESVKEKFGIDLEREVNIV